VFSASLSTYTISHGSDKPSSGPDLLLSYHDNDHYNSVRLSKPPRLPAPIRTFVKPDSAASAGRRIDVVESLGTHAAESSLDAKNASRVTDKLTRHALCDCGSGKRNRQCCHAPGRRKQKNVSSTARGSDISARDSDDDMDGTFRILRI
jgi:hypothetical protein